MAHEQLPVRIGRQGRVVIPAELRKTLGLEPGDRLVAWIDGDRLVLRSRRKVEEDLWAGFEGEEGLVEGLLRERREEARRETGG